MTMEHDRIPYGDGMLGDGCFRSCAACREEERTRAVAARPALDEAIAHARWMATASSIGDSDPTEVLGVLCDEIARLRDVLERIADTTIRDCGSDGDNLALAAAEDARAVLGMPPVPEER